MKGNLMTIVRWSEKNSFVNSLKRESKLKKERKMKTKLMTICAVVALVATGVQAAIVQYTYTFTGADLINNVFDSTARYSTDGSLKVHEGMRQIGTLSSYTGATFLSGGYLTDFNTKWNTAVTNGYTLNSFFLSGNNGYSGQWGEDYKPYQWISGTGPEGWTLQFPTRTSPASGSHTDQYPLWVADEGCGLVLNASNLASMVFTITAAFDTDDAWYGNPNNYLYGCNTAPNNLAEGLTMYFGSYIGDENGDIYRYIGNMYAVPEPATMLLVGLGGLALLRKRRA
jgi:hypothetical protein